MLGVFGILTILSSQSGAEQPFLLASRQEIFFAFGITVLFGAAALPFDLFKKNWLAAALFCLLLLLLLPCFGTRIHGMRGWFRFGEFSIQPAELAKTVFVLGIAVLLSGSGTEKERFFRQLFLPYAGSELLFYSLISEQPPSTFPSFC